MRAVSYRIDALEQKDFRVHVACSPRHCHSLCLRSLHQSRVSCRCCLASFLVAWVRKMSANHCLGLVMVSPPASSCRMLGQHQFHLTSPQTSMWLLVVGLLGSDAECRGAGRQGTFNRTQRDVLSVFLSRSQHGFHSAVGGVVSTCSVAKRRYNLLDRAR